MFDFVKIIGKQFFPMWKDIEVSIKYRCCLIADNTEVLSSFLGENQDKARQL